MTVHFIPKTNVIKTSLFKRTVFLLEDFSYFSPRYKKYVDGKNHDKFDGVTGWRHIISLAWIVHDYLCRDGVWADGTKVTAFQCMMVFIDILRSEGRIHELIWWPLPTFIFGGGACRKNGFFWLKKGKR